MKRIFFISAFCVCLTISFSQPAVQWKNSYGGSSNDFARFSLPLPGGFIIAGYTNSTNGDVGVSHGGMDMWIIRIDSAGKILWENSFGGSGTDVAYQVAETYDKGFIILGYTTSSELQGHHGLADVLVVKIDSAGNEKWKKVYGGSSDDGNIESAVLPLTDGGFIVTANTFSNDGDVSGNHGSGDFWLFRTDSLGNLLWQKCLGGSGDEDAHTLVQENDGSFVLAGHSSSANGDVPSNKGGEDFWIVKTDTSGNIKWSRTFGGSADDVAFYLSPANDSTYAVVGYSLSNDGDVSGNHGGTDIWFLLLDSAGNFKSQKSFGGSGGDYGTRILAESDGGFVLGGYSDSNDGDVSGNQGSFDYWVLKIDSSGTIVWQNTFGGSGNDRLYGISSAPSGYLMSGFSNSTDGDIDSSKGAMDVWALRLCFMPVPNFSFYTSSVFDYHFTDSSLNAASWLWSFGDGDSSSMQNPMHTYTTVGTFPVCLTAINNCDSATYCDTVVITMLGNQEVYSADFSVYPSVFCEGVTIQSKFEKVSFSVFDLFSQEIYSGLLKGQKTFVPMDSLRKGVYLLKLSCGEKSFIKKIIKN